MLVSIIIPARDEEDNIVATVTDMRQELTRRAVDYEIIVVNDNSRDATAQRVRHLALEDRHIILVENDPPAGFGRAVIKGLERFSGDVAVIVMADASDDPRDIIRYRDQIREGYDCCFGSRWQPDARVVGYPPFKWCLNRMGNKFLRCLFRVACDDISNAFKCYRREVIENIMPLRAGDFSLTLELPLRAAMCGYRYSVIPVNWRARRKGATKLKLKEMGSRYFKAILSLWLEKHRLQKTGT